MAPVLGGTAQVEQKWFISGNTDQPWSDTDLNSQLGGLAQTILSCHSSPLSVKWGHYTTTMRSNAFLTASHRKYNSHGLEKGNRITDSNI